MLHELTIYKKLEVFLTWIYPVLSRLPRSEKYTLGKRIEEILLQILEGLITANYEIDKVETLAKLRVQLESLQVLIRISKNIGVISGKQYEFSSRAINELKRMLLGWMKSTKKTEHKEKLSPVGVFGNYYLGVDFEDEVEEKEPKPNEALLSQKLTELNEKVDGRGKNRNSKNKESDLSGRWLFNNEEVKNDK